MEKGVFEGLPCFPIEYNISVNHIHKKLSEPEKIQKKKLYLVQPMAKLTYPIHPDIINFAQQLFIGFADDLAVASKTTKGALELGKIATTCTRSDMTQILKNAYCN